MLTASAPADRTHKLERTIKNRPTSAFGLLATIQVTLILAITVIAIALPAVQRDLGLTAGQLALVSAGYGLAFSGLLLLGGRLADMLGHRRMLELGLAIFGLASAAAGVAPGFGGLLVARLVQGVGAALAAPAAMALVRAVFPDGNRQKRAVAAWGGLAPIGATLGILVSGVAVTWASWRWGLALPGAVAAVAVVASRRLLPDGARPVPGGLDVPGAVLVTIGVAALSYGLVTAGDDGWSSVAARVALLAGTVALAGFAAVESKAAAPLVPLPILRSPRRAGALTAVMVVAAGHASLGFFLALYFQDIRGLSPIATTAAFLPLLLPLPLAGLAAARLVPRLGSYTVAAAGLALGATGLLLIGRIGVDTPYAGTFLVGLLVFPVGAGLTFSGGTVLAVQDTEATRAGLAGGLVNTAVELGPTLGLAVLVSLSSTRTASLLDGGHGPASATASGYGFALTTAAAVFAVAAVGLAVLGRRFRRDLPNPTTHNGGDS